MLSPSEWTHEEVLDKLTSLPINSILCFQKSTAGRPLRKEARARAAKSPWPFYDGFEAVTKPMVLFLAVPQSAAPLVVAGRTNRCESVGSGWAPIENSETVKIPRRGTLPLLRKAWSSIII